MRAFFLAWCLALAVASRPARQGIHWPVIAPVRASRTFTKPGWGRTDTPFLAFLRDVNGRPIYKFECHNGNFDQDAGIYYSGDFQCALFAVRGVQRTSWNLLATASRTEQTSDWANRGRMFASQLRGRCRLYPEYSTLRNFELRGMLVSLKFDDIEWSAGGKRLAGFRFTFEARPDPAATSATAAPPTGPRPPLGCFP